LLQQKSYFLLPIKIKQSKLAVIIRDKKLSSRNACRLVKDNHISDIDSSFLKYNGQYIYSRDRICKSFDKSIIALRIAIKKLGSIVEASRMTGFSMILYYILGIC
jgi:hypothetical protein